MSFEVISIPALAFNLPSSSLRLENCIVPQSGPDKYIKSKANKNNAENSLIQAFSNINVVIFSLESMSFVFHVITLENLGGTLLPRNPLITCLGIRFSKKGNRLWDY